MAAPQGDYQKPCQTHTNEEMETTNKKVNFLLFFPVSIMNVMHMDPALLFPGDLENIKYEHIEGTYTVVDLFGKVST